MWWWPHSVILKNLIERTRNDDGQSSGSDNPLDCSVTCQIALSVCNFHCTPITKFYARLYVRSVFIMSHESKASEWVREREKSDTEGSHKCHTFPTTSSCSAFIFNEKNLSTCHILWTITTTTDVKETDCTIAQFFKNKFFLLSLNHNRKVIKHSLNVRL